MSLQQIAVGQLCADDIGRRVVVISEGNTFDGVLRDISARHMFILTSWQEPYVNIEVSRPEDDKVSLRLKDLPLDYVIEIERPNEDFDVEVKYQSWSDSAIAYVRSFGLVVHDILREGLDITGYFTQAPTGDVGDEKVRHVWPRGFDWTEFQRQNGIG